MLPRLFDLRLLNPVTPADVGARTCAGTEALVAACRLGAGPATRPLWQPWARPHIEWPYGVFHVARAETARRACLQLDGSWALADARGPLGRWGVRLAAHAADRCWWRALRDADAWDAGVVRDLAALQGFRPRRATLLVIEHTALDAAALALLSQLEQQARDWPRAVRLVVAGGPPPAFARAVRG
jgi:hypothetical protein